MANPMYDLINKINSTIEAENQKRRKALETAYPVGGNVVGTAMGGFGLGPAINKIIGKTPQTTEQVGYEPLSRPEFVPEPETQPQAIPTPTGSDYGVLGSAAKTVARIPGQAAEGIVDMAAFLGKSKSLAEASQNISRKNYELFPSDAPAIATMDDFRRASWADLGIATLEGTGSIVSSAISAAVPGGAFAKVSKMVPVLSRLSAASPKIAGFINRMGGAENVARKTASIFGSVGLEAGSIAKDSFQEKGEMPEYFKTLYWAVPAGILEGLSRDRLFGGEARLVAQIEKKLGSAAAAEAKSRAGGAAVYLISKAKDMGWEGGTEWVQNFIEEMGVKNLGGMSAGEAITSTLGDPNAHVRAGMAGLSGLFGAGGVSMGQDLAGAIFKAKKSVPADPTTATKLEDPADAAPVTLPPIQPKPTPSKPSAADVGGVTSADDAKSLKRKAAMKTSVIDAIQSMSATGDIIPDDQINSFIFEAFGKNLADMNEQELQQAFDTIMEQGAMGETVDISQPQAPVQAIDSIQPPQTQMIPQNQPAGAVAPETGMIPAPEAGMIPDQRSLVAPEPIRREVQFPQIQEQQQQLTEPLQQLPEPQQRLPEPQPRQRPADIQQAIEAARRQQLPAPEVQRQLPPPPARLQEAIERAAQPKQLPAPVVEPTAPQGISQELFDEEPRWAEVEKMNEAMRQANRDNWEGKITNAQRGNIWQDLTKKKESLIKQIEAGSAKKTESVAPVAPKAEPAFTVKSANGGFAVISPDGEQVSWNTSKTSAESRANELNAGQSDKIAANALSIGDKVTYDGEVWEVGFINELTRKGTVRLQKTGDSSSKQLNYIPADQVTKITEPSVSAAPATTPTTPAATPTTSAAPVQTISSDNAAMLQNAAKLRASAQALIDKSQKEIRRDRQTNTNKRAREAGQAISAAMEQEAFAKTAIKLADAMERGEIKHLAKVKSRPDLEVFKRLATTTRQKFATKNNISYEKSKDLILTDDMIDDAAIFENPTTHRSTLRDLANTLDKLSGFKPDAKIVQKVADTMRGDNDYGAISPESVDKLNAVIAKAQRAGIKAYEVARVADALDQYNRLKKFGINNTADLKAALKEYNGLSVQKAEESKLAKAERALTGKSFEGFDFFPTPTGLAKRIAEELDIKPGMKVLEPSAGKGDLADAVKAAQPEAVIKVVEPLGDLREILTEKGYDIVDNNFDDYQTDEKFDRIIMNPPFSKNRDIKHIRKAYDMLAPGGKLMAIASNHFTFASDKESVAFREWLDTVGGEQESLGQAFMGKDAFRQTGVNSQLITIEKAAEAKPAAKPIAEPAAESAPKSVIEPTKTIPVADVDLTSKQDISDRLQNIYRQTEELQSKPMPERSDLFKKRQEALKKFYDRRDALESRLRKIERAEKQPASEPANLPETIPYDPKQNTTDVVNKMAVAAVNAITQKQWMNIASSGMTPYFHVAIERGTENKNGRIMLVPKGDKIEIGEIWNQNPLNLGAFSKDQIKEQIRRMTGQMPILGYDAQIKSEPEPAPRPAVKLEPKPEPELSAAPADATQAIRDAYPTGWIKNQRDESLFIGKVKKALAPLGVDAWKIDSAVKNIKDRKRKIGTGEMVFISDEDLIQEMTRTKDIKPPAAIERVIPNGGVMTLTESERALKDLALKRGEVYGKIIDYGKIFTEFNRQNKPWRITNKQESRNATVNGKTEKVYYMANVVTYAGKKRGEAYIEDGKFDSDSTSISPALDKLNEIYKSFQPEYVTGKAPESASRMPAIFNVKGAPSKVWDKKPSSTSKAVSISPLSDGYAVDGKWAIMTKDKAPVERADEVRASGESATVARVMSGLNLGDDPKFKIPLMSRAIPGAQVYFITDGTEALRLIVGDNESMVGVSPITDGKVTGKETYYDYNMIREIQSFVGEVSYVESASDGRGHLKNSKGESIVLMPTEAPEIIQNRRAANRPLYSAEYLVAAFIAKHGKKAIESGIKYFKQGMKQFSDWSGAMVSKFGAEIKSGLREIYNRIRTDLARMSFAVDNFTATTTAAVSESVTTANDQILSIIDSWTQDGRVSLLDSAYNFISRGGGSLIQWVKTVSENLRQFASKAWKDAQKLLDLSGGKGATRRGGRASLMDLARSIRKANALATEKGTKPLPQRAADELINEATTASYNLGEADATAKADKAAAATAARAEKKIAGVRTSAEAKLTKVKRTAGARYDKIRKQLKDYKEQVKLKAEITFEARKNLRTLAMKLPADIRWKTMKAITEAKTMNQVSNAVDLIDRLYEDFQRRDAIKDFRKSLRDLNKLRPQFKALAEGLAMITKEGDINAPAVYEFMQKAIDLLGESDTAVLPDSFLSQAEFLLKTRPKELNRRTITFLADSFNTIKFISGLENERIFAEKNQTVDEFTKKANTEMAGMRKMTDDEGKLSIADRVFNIWATQYADFTEIAGKAFRKVFYDDVAAGKRITTALRLKGKDVVHEAMRSVDIDPEDGKTLDWFEEETVIKTDKGDVKATREEKMNLVANLLDKDTNREIINRTSIKKGKDFGRLIQGAGFYLEAEPDTTHYLTMDESISIVNSLSSKERAIVEAMRAFVNGDLKRGFNRAMVDLSGYEKAVRNDHWPRKRKITTPLKLADGFKAWLKGSLENSGITKERVTSKLPVLIEGITKVYNRHLRAASNIAGLAVPIRNINMALGKNKLKENLDARFGKEFVERIQKQLEVISEVDRPIKGFFSETVRKLLDNVAIGYLGLNPRASVKQFGGLFTLSTEIEYKYIKQAFWAKFDKDVEAEMYAWSPALRDRYDSSASKLVTPTFEKDSGLFRDRDEIRKNKAMFLLEKGDKAVSLVAWEAVKAKLKETQPGLKGDALLGAVARETESIISRTQNVSDTMDMSGMAIDSRTDALAKALTMFQSQNNTILNIVRRATIKFKAGDIEWPELAKILGVALIGNALFSSLMGKLLSITLYKQIYRKDATAASLAANTAFDVAEDAIAVLPGANLFGGAFRKVKNLAEGTTFGGPAKIENVVESALNNGANAAISALGVVSEWGEVYETGKRRGQYKSRKQFENAVEGAVRSLLPLTGRSSYPVTETWNLLMK